MSHALQKIMTRRRACLPIFFFPQALQLTQPKLFQKAYINLSLFCQLGVRWALWAFILSLLQSDLKILPRFLGIYIFIQWVSPPRYKYLAGEIHKEVAKLQNIGNDIWVLSFQNTFLLSPILDNYFKRVSSRFQSGVFVSLKLVFPVAITYRWKHLYLLWAFVHSPLCSVLHWYWACSEELGHGIWWERQVCKYISLKVS